MGVSEGSSIGVYEYGSVVILFLVNMLNYMDRYTIASVLTQVQKSFNIDDAQGGLLQTVFIVFFMVFAPVCGFLGDRYNRKWIMVAGVAVWVFSVLVSSFIPDRLFWVFVMMRGVVGIGEASYIVIAPTIIADTFVSVARSRVLMVFYFAIPVGSGMGYMISSWVASLFDNWRWGIRITPFFGVVCLLLIIIFIQEPQRGEAEKSHGAVKALDMEATSFWEDFKAICKIPTFVYATIGYTTVVFVVGTLGWWAPAAVEHAHAMNEGLNNTHDLPKSKKDSISLIFGAITLAGGVVGVFTGGIIAQLWHKGKWCFKPIKTSRSNALVCAIGCVVAIPFLSLGMHLVSSYTSAAWICIFIAITNLCLNWSTNADVLIDVVIPRRRGAANAWQTTVSHLFGDASGPYIVGLISDWIRGEEDTPKGHYDSLVTAFYVPTVLLIIGSVLFFVAAYYFVHDHRVFQQEMGFLEPAAYPKSEDSHNNLKNTNGMVNAVFNNSQF